MGAVTGSPLSGQAGRQGVGPGGYGARTEADHHVSGPRLFPDQSFEIGFAEDRAGVAVAVGVGLSVGVGVSGVAVAGGGVVVAG